MKKQWILLFVIIFLSFSKSYAQNDVTLSKELLEDIIKSIPSPLETAYLVKDLAIPYSNQLLNPNRDVKRYNSEFLQSLNLGIYTADLGYSAIYGQKNDAVARLEDVISLAQQLKIANQVDFEMLKQVVIAQDNLTLLLEIRNETLNKLVTDLQTKNRTDLSILFMTGEWLEALFISCQIAKHQPSELLYKRIGEQKIVLEQLILLLTLFEQKPEIKFFLEEIVSLKNAFDGVIIQYEDEKSESKIVDGVLIVDEGAEAKITLTSQTLTQILEAVIRIRQKIIL